MCKLYKILASCATVPSTNFIFVGIPEGEDDELDLEVANMSGSRSLKPLTLKLAKPLTLEVAKPLTLKLANRIDAPLTQDAIFSQKISHPVEPPLKRCLLK